VRIIAHVAHVALAMACLTSTAVASPARTLPHGLSREPIVIRAAGTFEVTLTPRENDTPNEGASLGRMTIDKQFHGDLQGTSKGEMLTAMTAVKTSAVYVAVERISGTLHGKTGTFAVHHTGIMNKGDQTLTITVVPDSGTGELAGISGFMTIDVANGKHSYVLEYRLP